MKTKLLLPIVLIAMATFLGESAELPKSLPTFASSDDNGEFKKYPTGLMYSDNTMRQLGRIVDSLNIKFRTCEPNRTYLSKYQARAHYFSLEKGDVRKAKKDIDNNVTFEEVIKKYGKSESNTNLLVIKYKSKNYDDEEVVFFNSVINELYIQGPPSIYDKPMKNTWIYDYWEDSESDEKSISGFYFTSEFETQPIPIQYARMIQYSDCMVDTTTEIFKADAKRDRNYKESGKIAEFLKYVHEESDKPHFWEDRNKPKDFRTWDSVRFALVESKLSKQEKFQKMLKAAVAEALVEGSNEAFDEYVARFYSKQTALELRRNRIVVGSCSQDNSPRVHAMKIAVLSAETVNWETFLRAHLDIMNDRFQRRSDGSYAWAGRQTYIQELEALDINVMDLMLGISLRLENPSQKHYFGSIGRLGRALSETKYAAEIETKILSMLKDDELDDYNRLLMYYLFDNYNYHIKDESRKKENAARLSAAVQEMPEYLAVKLAAKK